MKQLAFYLLLALPAFLVPNYLYAQNPEEGEEIEVTVEVNQTENGPTRTIPQIPFTATLFRSLSCIEVEFYDNIGEVTISLNNLTTGSFTSPVVNSQNGFAIIPLPASPGLWQITFQPEGGGVIYNGTFIL